jgi:hypothetical protein
MEEVLEMGVLTRRNRTITFRVSVEEYEALREFCCSVGARSISDFARAAVHEVMGSKHTGLYPLLSQVRQLVRQQGELSDKVTELSGRLDDRGCYSKTDK